MWRSMYRPYSLAIMKIRMLRLSQPYEKSQRIYDTLLVIKRGNWKPTRNGGFNQKSPLIINGVLSRHV